MEANFMSAKEAAEVFGVKARAISNAARKGRLSFQMVGRTLAIIQDEKFHAFSPGASRWDKERPLKKPRSIDKRS